MRGYGAAGTPFMKVSTGMLLIDSFICFNLLGTLVGYNLPRQISTSIAISTAPVQRFQSVSSASTSFTSSQLVSQLKADFWVIHGLYSHRSLLLPYRHQFFLILPKLHPHPPPAVSNLHPYHW